MCGRFNGVVHEIVTPVSDAEKSAVRKLLSKPRAKEEFLRRFKDSGCSKEETDRIAKAGDMVTFFSYLVAEVPAMRVEWEVRDQTRLSFENSSVALYVFAGSWFASVNGSRLSSAVRYSLPLKAILPHADHLRLAKKEPWGGRPDCGVYRSARSAEGMKHISANLADKIVSKLTSLESPIAHGKGNQYELLWGEVDADAPYFDSYHDLVGKAVREVQVLKAAKGKKDKYTEASLKLKKLMKTQGCQRLMFRRGEVGFRGVDDSFVMRVGFSAKGNLLGFRGKWIRMFYEEQHGVNLFLLVHEIEMPRRVSRRLLQAVGSYQQGELETWRGNRVPPHWDVMEVDGKKCRFIDDEWKPFETK